MNQKLLAEFDVLPVGPTLIKDSKPMVATRCGVATEDRHPLHERWPQTTRMQTRTVAYHLQSSLVDRFAAAPFPCDALAPKAATGQPSACTNPSTSR
jgi:hypothetical protein